MGYLDSRMLCRQYHKAYLNDQAILKDANIQINKIKRQSTAANLQLQQCYSYNLQNLSQTYNARISVLTQQQQQYLAEGNSNAASQCEKQIEALKKEMKQAQDGLESQRQAAADSYQECYLTPQDKYWEGVKEQYDEKTGQTAIDKGMWESAKASMQEALAQMFPKQSNQTT